MTQGTITKIILFTAFFSVIFFFIKFTGFIPQTADDASSLGWLFSVAGVIFGVLSGFVIQMKWSIWDRLVEATNAEISSIRQLHSLIDHLPETQHSEIEKKLRQYVIGTISKIQKTDNKTNGLRVDGNLLKLEESIYKLYEDEEVTHIDSIAYELFRKIMDWHGKRINYSQEHLLPIIRLFIFANAGLLIFLSILLPVQSLGLDYIFTLSIALLSYGIYLLIDDLDHPFRPGNWHLGSKIYSDLLEELNHQEIN